MTTASGYDVERVRADFPSLRSGIAHLDGPGGTQTPRQVGEAVAGTLTGPLSNRGRATLADRRADEVVTDFRAAFADLLGISPAAVVHGRSMTQLVYDLSRTLARGWDEGDEVVLTRLDHDANVRPWVQAAERTGATVRWIDVDPGTGELDVADLGSTITERTTVVALTAASNLIGTMPDVRAVADAAHAVRALVVVDGVHQAAHGLVDVAALGADLYLCSPYKFLGPHCGVMAAASVELLESLHPDKLLPSSDAVPERFELGTLPYELLAGASAAVDYIAAIAPGAGDVGDRRGRLASSWDAVEAHESRLRARLEDGLRSLGDEVVLWSRAQRRTPTLLLTLRGRSTAQVSAFLAERAVLAPAGSFYAIEASRRLGLGDDGGLRLGLAPYSSDDDVDRVLTGLEAFLQT